MPSVCFYFQVHQPWRIRRFSFFDHGELFDTTKNKEILLKVAHKCYLPTNSLLLSLIKQYQGAFKIAYSVTGVAIDQMKAFCPEVLDSFKRLNDTGCVEFLGETYYHSLASVYDPEEFSTQVKMHAQVMKKEFGVSPQVFRNTELIYNDHIGQMVAALGYKGVVAEGADDILQWRSPDFLYQVPGTSTRLLLKNYRLSDDIAFRFSNRSWKEFPLTTEKFAHWVHSISGNGDTVNLFMDYETFGEHQWESTGIFQFLEHLPRAILAHGDWNFATPSQVIERYPSRADLHVHRLTSWADLDRDLTAWNGNQIQREALKVIYELKQKVFATKKPETIEMWRKLLTSDHFYYMCTKWFGDGDVHAYFSPFESPYDAFIYYMNVVRRVEESITTKNSVGIEYVV